MAFVKHRHDQMHRGQVPADQLAEGTPDPGDTPHYQYDGSVAWEPESAAGVTDHGALSGLGDDDHPQYNTATLHIDLTVTGAHTADRDDGATHDLTLIGNTTLTPDATTTVAGDSIDLRVIVRQDGVGGRTLAFGGTITWAGGSAPTMPSAANAVLTLGFLSLDDGTSWLGYEASGGSGGTAASTVESETSFGISAAVGTDTEYARQDHTHGSPANPVTAAAVAAVGYWAPLVDSGSGDLIRDEDSNEIIVAFVPTP